jgi:hypothetical protein
MGFHFTREERLDALRQRHAFAVAKLGIRLWVAILVPTDRRCLVAFGQCGKDRLSHRRWHYDPGLLGGGLQDLLELGAILEHSIRQ